MDHSEYDQRVPLLSPAKMWTVFFVQLNEAYQVTMLLPMVVFMCRDFGIQPQWLGVYTSILNASFCFCSFLVAYFWGIASDRFGRKPTLIVGNLLSAISIVFFGTSKSYALAIITRSLCGLFQGNLGVVKAYLADITNSENRAYAFGIVAIAYGFGSILGAMVGGLFIITHDVDVTDAEYHKTQSIFWIFKNEYPFLPPCLFGALLSFNALLWILFNVKNGEKEMEDVPKYESMKGLSGIL